MDVTGDRSKVRCCKEQYCIGTWNVHESRQIRSGQTRGVQLRSILRDLMAGENKNYDLNKWAF